MTAPARRRRVADKPGAPREFECKPEWGGSVGGWSWHDKVTINPRFIAGVSPYAEQFAVVMLAGATAAFPIKAPYDGVVSWWLEAINA